MRADTGDIPKTMRAAVIRRERYGQPRDAFRIEEVPVPIIRGRQVLLAVMAAGVNYNGVWAATGSPVDLIAARQNRGLPETYHVAGSDASGIVRAVGPDAKSVRVGDEVIVSCGQHPDAVDRPDEKTWSTAGSQIWGYETNHGAFAQFALVEDYQCHPKPAALSWEDAACFMLTGATAFHQLRGWPPHVVLEGDPVLIWGGAGGLGSAAIQIVRHFGGIPIAMASSDERVDHCRRLGALTIDRRPFSHWGHPPGIADQAATDEWLREVRRFGGAIWNVLGERRSPRIVVEHPGGDTLPTSLYVCGNDGMVVTCGATTGYLGAIDLRFLWMRQKRLQGSHFATVAECGDFLALVSSGAVRPCLSRVFAFEEIGYAHQLMFENLQPPGNMAIRIGSSNN